MRAGRWLILAAIFAIIVFVGDTYFRHRTNLDALAAPRPLDLGLEASMDSWCYKSADGAKETFEICSKNARDVKDPPRMELDGVRLKLFHKEDKEYDLIETDKAEFDNVTKNLYSDSQVVITMGVAAEGAQHGRLLKIHTSGVHFDKDSGRATTDRAAAFEFDQGTGSATGAEYDPDTRQLHLREPGCPGLARQDGGCQAHAHRGGRGLLFGARIEGRADAVVQAFARRLENGRRHVDGADGA